MTERASQHGERPTLDDMIDSGDVAAMDRLAHENAASRRQLEIQSRIDESLRRVFQEQAVATAGSVARHQLRRWIPWAAAAALLLASFAGWRVCTVSTRPDILGPLYHKIVDAGFKPDSVCTTDAEFAGWCRSYLRQAMYPTSRPDGLEYVGWSRAPVLGPVSAILLARVHDQPVIVVMERTDSLTDHPGRIKDPNLHVFRKSIGDVVLYEVTPAAHTTILPVIDAKPAR